MNIPLRIAAGIDRISDALGRLVSWLTLVMVLVATYNTLARYLGRYAGKNLTSNAILEAQWYLFSAVFLLGAAYALKHNVHVRVDVLYDRVGPRARAWINLTGAVFFLLPFSIFVLWASWRPVLSSWRIHEISSDPGGLPRYPVKTLIPIAFILIILQGISEIIKLTAFLRRGGEEPESESEEAGT